MSGLRTIIAAGLSSVFLMSDAFAMPGSASERVKAFAACAGRLSALEENQRLFDGPLSEKTAARKAMFDSLVEATLPDARAEGFSGRQALHWQVDAKMAQAVLLQQSVFGTDPARADEARQLANDYLATCDRLLLGA